MAKLAVNLLPPELKEKEKTKGKRQKVTNLSIGVVLLAILIAAGVLLFKYNQKIELDHINNLIKDEKNTLSQPDYVKKEQLITILNSRVNSINTLTHQPAPAFYAYSIFDQLMTPNTNITSLSVDDTGALTASVASSDLASLDGFFNNIINTQKTNQSLEKVNVDSFNLGGSGKYNVDLSMKLLIKNTK